MKVFMAVALADLVVLKTRKVAAFIGARDQPVAMRRWWKRVFRFDISVLEMLGMGTSY